MGAGLRGPRPPRARRPGRAARGTPALRLSAYFFPDRPDTSLCESPGSAHTSPPTPAVELHLFQENPQPRLQAPRRDAPFLPVLNSQTVQAALLDALFFPGTTRRSPRRQPRPPTLTSVIFSPEEPQHPAPRQTRLPTAVPCSPQHPAAPRPTPLRSGSFPRSAPPRLGPSQPHGVAVAPSSPTGVLPAAPTRPVVPHSPLPAPRHRHEPCLFALRRRVRLRLRPNPLSRRCSAGLRGSLSIQETKINPGSTEWEEFPCPQEKNKRGGTVPEWVPVQQGCSRHPSRPSPLQQHYSARTTPDKNSPQAGAGRRWFRAAPPWELRPGSDFFPGPKGCKSHPNQLVVARQYRRCAGCLGAGRGQRAGRAGVRRQSGQGAPAAPLRGTRELGFPQARASPSLCPGLRLLVAKQNAWRYQPPRPTFQAQS